jgi:uncharacterized protein YoxC
MTVEVDIFNLIILLVVILVAAFLLPMIWQLKKTSHKADALLGELHRELLPTLRDCREIAERINRVSVKIEKGSGQAENLLESLDEITDSVRRITHFIRQDASFIIENAAYLIWGIKAASKVLFKETRETPEKGE